MLNVGPKADGTIPEPSVKCLKEMDVWLKIKGEAIYGTTYGPVAPQPWGATTLKPGKLFLHVTECPKNRELLVPGVDAKVKKVSLLDYKIFLEYSCTIEDCRQEGLLQVGDKNFHFETLGTGS